MDGQLDMNILFSNIEYNKMLIIYNVYFLWLLTAMVHYKLK